jgi:1,2-phenylacetyl-CoA epoxidase catalytic subunit
MGLRKSSNAELKTRWEAETKAILEKLGLKAA